jgi:hypothetical protein
MHDMLARHRRRHVEPARRRGKTFELDGQPKDPHARERIHPIVNQQLMMDQS